VTSRVRLDEKYAERRAAQNLTQRNLISRVFSKYFCSEMPGSSPAYRRAREPSDQLPGTINKNFGTISHMPAPQPEPKQWDIFCQVIDNFGDIGVCWRLACNLAQRGQRVRLWVDDPSVLRWMAPHVQVDAAEPHHPVQVRTWTAEVPHIGVDMPGDVVIEAFGCTIDPAWVMSRSTINSIAARAVNTASNHDFASKKVLSNEHALTWVNLEYLSAEGYAARNHGLPSPVMAGPATGMTKWFFYPGFTVGTGGLLREEGIALPDALPLAVDNTQRVSLFCYESPALPQLLQQLIQGPHNTQLQVTHGRVSSAVQTALQTLKKPVSSNQFNNEIPLQGTLNLLNQLSNLERLEINFLTLMPQSSYDALLRSCHLNVVRGEDSLVRALWAGQAFVWHIYPQDDGAHAAKLDAFLDWLQAPADLRLFHYVWNGLSQQPLPLMDWATWAQVTQQARARLVLQDNLAKQLIVWCASH
jgi:uncharacterized repeat protein (TIGR03837 family)